MAMTSTSTHQHLQPETSIILTYTDIEKVTEIDHYYIGKMKEVRDSLRLNEEEKTGQRAFLHKLWQEEIGPFLILWSVKLYFPL